jgi:lysyl-tRNA synthetase class 2
VPRPPIVRVERHLRGPRLFVAGLRIHEVTVGAAIASVLLLGYGVHALRLSAPLLLAATAAAWLVAKDWRDAVPALRDTGSWSIGIHRRFSSLRKTRRSDGLPVFAAAAALIVAAANIASAITPDVPARAHLLTRLEPVVVPPLAHALALPVGGALAVVGLYLFKRRRRALHTALALLVLVGCLDLLKGLDVEEAALSWTCAGLLWWGRDAFCVKHDPVRRLAGVWRVAALWTAAVNLAALAVWASTGWSAGIENVARETGALLVWSTGPLPIAGDFGWLPLGIGTLGVIALLASAGVLFRPLAVPRRSSGDEGRTTAFHLVRAHGRDTLAFFKLRRDNRLFFSADRGAFVAYRISGRTLLISGDPVGRSESLPGLVSAVCEFAEQRGLALGAVGVSDELLELYRDAGLRALYIGDEALVDTRTFSLEGRAVRKVRQSVSRLTSAGFTAELSSLDDLDAAALEDLERVSSAWRAGAPERGFAMAMDGLSCAHGADTALVVARDARGAVRGFLHFVPTYGREAVSLSLMRRDRDAPNGLTEFLVVRAIEELRGRGIEEISLNFAAFGQWMRAPRTRIERHLGRVASLADRCFQIESLQRFNAKFSPRWEPRYLLYERALDLPRVALATMRVEGHLPALPRRTTPLHPHLAPAK